MDFELEQNVVLCYETVGQASVCQEETQEAIVPDACPDILRIVEVCAQAFPTRGETGDGQATVVGMIQANVIYLPEKGELLQTMPLRLPFSVRGEIQGMGPDAILEMSARITRADARVLNPRKILLRCDLLVEVGALHRREYTVSSAVAHPERGHICQRQERLEYERISAAPRRIFPISEEIRLSGEQAPVLLGARASAVCAESKVIGNKLIFKGKTEVELLLQMPDGEMERRVESFPFSQILEAKGAGENGSCYVRLSVSEFSCVQPLDDPFHLMVEGEVLAMGRVRETEELDVLVDLYSTTHVTQPDWEEVRLWSPSQRMILPMALRDLLETGDVVRSVCDSRFLPGHMLWSREQDTVVVTTQGRVCVLYLDEERQPRLMEKDVELTARLNCPVGTELLDASVFPGELYLAPCAGGIEVRLSAELSALTARPQFVSVVSRAGLGESRSTEGVRPSVLLRLPERGETLWDIAKSCGTTQEEIMQANELAGEELPEGKMLLIPSVR